SIREQRLLWTVLRRRVRVWRTTLGVLRVRLIDRRASPGPRPTAWRPGRGRRRGLRRSTTRWRWRETRHIVARLVRRGCRRDGPGLPSRALTRRRFQRWLDGDPRRLVRSIDRLTRRPPLCDRLEEQDRSGNRGVERPDRAEHRDPHEQVGTTVDLRAQPLPLATDGEREGTAQIRFTGGQRCIRLGPGDTEAAYVE